MKTRQLKHHHFCARERVRAGTALRRAACHRLWYGKKRSARWLQLRNFSCTGYGNILVNNLGEIRAVFAALAVTFVLLLGILKLSGSGSSRPMAEAWSETQAQRMVVSQGVQ